MTEKNKRPSVIFPTANYTMIPNSLLEEDIFSLSAWEIRMMLFFFKNLHAVPQVRIIEESVIAETFGEVTSDLSDTQKATPSIVKMTLAALVKKGYLKVMKRAGDKDGEMIYTLRLGKPSPKTAEQKPEASPKPKPKPEVKPEPEIKEKVVNESASIQFVEDTEVESAAPKIKTESPKGEWATTMSAAPEPAKTEKETPPEKPKVPDISGEALKIKHRNELKKQEKQAPEKPDEKNDTPGSLKTDLQSAFDKIEKEEIPEKPEVKIEQHKPEDTEEKQEKSSSKVLDLGAFSREIEDDISNGDEEKTEDREEKTEIKKEPEPEEAAKEEKAPEPEKPKEPETKPEEPAKKPEPQLAGLDPDDDEPVEEKTHHHEVKIDRKTRENLSPDEERGKEIWDQVLKQMHILLDNMTYNTWLKPSKYDHFKDGVHYIEVESVKFYDKFNKLWGNLLQEVVMVIDPEFEFEFFSN